MENQLPIGWVECDLSELVIEIDKIDKDADKDLLIDYVDISAINNQINIVEETKSFVLRDAPSRAKQIIKAGDVLFSLVRPYLKNIAAVPERLNNQVASTGFCILRPSKGLDEKFLFYKVVSGNFINAVSGKQYGVSYPAVKEEQVKGQVIALPPLNEQKRIVAKIEQLFSELDNGIAALKTAREQLKVYRQAVLKHAFEGKLTTQWREDNKDKLELPEQLLARIQEEREARYQQQLEGWKAAVKAWEANGKEGKKPGKPKALKPMNKITSEEISVLPTMPKDWKYARLAEISNIGSGMSVSKNRKLNNPIEVPYLRVANVQRGHLVLDEIKTMFTEKDDIHKLALEKWDVLFNEGGDRDKLGRGWIWESQIQPCITQNHVFRASPILKSDYHSKFISHWGNSFGKDYFEKGGKQTTNLASINKTVLSNFPIPLPPMEEQRQLIDMLDGVMSQVDAMEIEVANGIQKAETLRQSILKKAFSGQLVPQDPSDEPASELLARIQAEKAAQQTVAKRKVVKKPATKRVRKAKASCNG